jgi:hypothetical protein
MNLAEGYFKSAGQPTMRYIGPTHCFTYMDVKKNTKPYQMYVSSYHANLNIYIF